MNGFLQRRGWLFLFAAATMLVSSATAQNVTNLVLHGGPFVAPAAIKPPPSPMDYFRRLLAASPQERQILLAKKKPQVRQRILAKVNEYAALDPQECELRLRATELHLYLMPLLRAAPGDRAPQLALVPDNIRDLVKSRLMLWETLPPPLQQEFLDNEHVMSYFSGVDSTNKFAGTPGLSDAEQSRWNALPDNKRNAMTAQFNQFFELSSFEKQKALDALSDNEREQMEKTMQTLDKLPPPQQILCLLSYTKFAGMSPEERAEFLKNAQRWTNMSPADRKAWIDLAAHVPQWPPSPPGLIISPMPPARPNFHSLTATNHS
jgi:hypothetical protein